MTLPGLSIEVDSEVPVYRQIADGIRAAAGDGRLSGGRKLPPTRDLARQLGVNRNTVVAAYEILASEGVVQSHTGRGTFLVASPGWSRGHGAIDDETWFTAFSRASDATAQGGLQSIYRLVIADERISFVGSYPTPELLPVDEFREAMNRALEEAGPRLLAYGPTAGYPPLREAIASRMEVGGRGRIDPSELLVTNGAQQGVELVFQCFVDPGDAVVVEEPTYTGALTVASAVGARVVGVPVDEQGIRPDLLAIALERHRPKLIYVQPTYQNPSTALMGEARRREILDLAARYRCPVVEDDWASDIRFEGPRLPSLHALDQGRHVIHVGTFSKKLMPGLRVGWVAAPKVVIHRMVELKRIHDCGTSPLIQAALHVFLREGGLERHLERIRSAYRERRDCMMGALQRHFPEQTRWACPAGGLFVWVRLPEGTDGGELFVAAQRRGVLYSRGELFHSDGSGGNAMRLAFSAASPPQIEEGIGILGKLVREQLVRSEPTRRENTETMPIL